MIRKAENKKKNRFFFILLLVLVVVAIVFAFWGREIGRIDLIQNLKRRIEEKTNFVREKIWRQKLNLEGSGTKEEELLKKIASLEFELADLKEENQAFIKQLEAPLPPDLQILPAQVIGINKYLYINKGRQDGVKRGDAVLSENFFVGQIIEISEKTAKVLLPIDPESKISVKTEQGTLGLLVGDPDQGLRLEKVLQGGKLAKGDLIGLSGERNLPKGVIIGKIKTLSGSEKEVYQEAIIEPIINYQNLLHVFVVR